MKSEDSVKLHTSRSEADYATMLTIEVLKCVLTEFFKLNGLLKFFNVVKQSIVQLW